MQVRLKYLAIILTVILLVSGCDLIELGDNEFVCDPPYRRHMDSCCLDKDWNKVCDSDEAVTTEPIDVPDTPSDTPDTPDDTPDTPDDTPDTPPDTPDDSCAGVSCPSNCAGDVRNYNGNCVSGECQYQTETCDFGCTGGICDPDHCDGMSCPDTCDGDTRKYSGACSDGSCVYDTEVCLVGCTGGVCDADPCAGVSCPDTCDGTTRKYNGACDDGTCMYDSEECPQGCDGGECIDGFIVFTRKDYTYCNIGAGGITSANTLCQNSATAAGLTGQFRAWLSDSTVDAKNRITVQNKPYYLVDGVKVANNLADMLDGSLLTSLGVAEDGSAVTAPVWTGTASSGLKSSANSLDYCMDWTTDAGQSTVGNPGVTNSGWTDDYAQTKHFPGHLYCFQDEWTAYYCEWSWPQKVTYQATGDVYASCPSSTPYCHRYTGKDGRPQCCDWTEEAGYFNCADV